MRSSARLTLLSALMCLCFAVSSFAQSPGKQQVKTPRGSISGRITINDKPAPGVVVGLRKGALDTSFDPFDRAVTDAEGIYRITNVPAGNYVVTVIAPTHVPTNSETRRAVVVREDENVEGLDFSLVRGGVITGKITDAEGRPVLQQQIEIYSQPLIEVGKALPFPAMSVKTDDQGIYRVFGVAPGSYIVAAGRGKEGYGGYSPSQFNPKQVFYHQVFHPDATDPAKAIVIEVSEGGEVKDVDIRLGRPGKTFSASGRIINSETNAPAPTVRFILRFMGRRMEAVIAVTSSNDQGDFVVEGLMAGKYSTALIMNEGSDLRAEATTFEVIDRDVSGVTIKLNRGASISGLVIIESENKAAKARLADLLVRGSVPPTSGVHGYPASSSPIAADGSFRLAGIPNGVVRIYLGDSRSPSPPTSFSILRIERDGMLVARLEVKEAEQVAGVKIFVGYGNAAIRGVVKIENGSLTSETSRYVRVERPGESNTYVRQAMIDERGNFLVEGIPPGQYVITVTVFGGGVNKTKTAKQEVSLTDGVVTDVRMTIDLATPDNP